MGWRVRSISEAGTMALVTLLTASCSQPGQLLGKIPAEPPLPPGINVAFNHRDGARYRSPLTGQWRNGDNLEQLVIEAIATARAEILVAVQEISLPEIATALVQAQKRGVRVQVILENTYSIPWSEQHPADLAPHGRHRLEQLEALADRNHDGVLSTEERHNGDAVAILTRAGVPLLDDTEDGSKGSGLMHHKFVVIDRAVVVSGSANFTSSGMHGDAGAASTRGNVNHLLQIASPELAALFAAEFARMWGDGPGGSANSRFGRGKESGGVETAQVGNTRIEVLFAPHARSDPHHGLRLIGERLATAQQSIDMALFVFSAQELADVLRERVEQGVEVRLLADPGFASRSFSEVLDLLGVALPDRFCKLEAGNNPLETPLQGVGTPRLARGDKLHHKLAVIDGKSVITGSFNWSPSAAHQNDETLMLIHSPQLAAHFTREIDRMWRGAELGVTARMQRKLERQQQRCGSGEQRG
jgi:phosphatidylserine/phosphatidylglycerophosphate/cardiolipin synthase-like enzyme